MRETCPSGLGRKHALEWGWLGQVKVRVAINSLLVKRGVRLR